MVQQPDQDNTTIPQKNNDVSHIVRSALPTDADIKIEAKKYAEWDDGTTYQSSKCGFERGAKWLRNKIKLLATMKLGLTTETKTAIWKIGNAALMCQDNDITSAKYEEISLEAINEANEAHLKISNCNIPLVSGCVCPECLNERAFSNKLGWCFCHDCGHEWEM